MKIIKERSRLIITEYTDNEKHKIENMVSTMDNIFIHTDEDKNSIYLPTGLESKIATMFKINIEDNSNSYWKYETITKPNNAPFSPRDQMQTDIIDFTINNAKAGNNIAIIAFPGSGKEQPYSTKIPTPTEQGWTRMGDLQVDDCVFDKNGKLTKVLQIFEQGVKDVYKITFSDGRHALCGADHLWNVTDEILKKSFIMDTIDISKNYILSDNTSYRYHIPICSPVEYPYKELPIDPYIMGLFISQGNFTSDILNLFCYDYEIANRIANKYNWTYKKSKNHDSYCSFYDINDNPVYIHEFFKDFPDLIGNAENYIPNIYMYNDINNRMELMKGLMDAGGNILVAGGIYHTTYSSNSDKLLNQMQEILFSLGLTGTILEGGPSGINIYGYDNKLVFNIPNHLKKYFFSIGLKSHNALDAYTKSNYNDYHYDKLYITGIRLVRKEESRCIMVDNPEHLYLTEDYIVTHNTSMTIACLLEVGLRSLIIVPTTNIRRQWKSSLIKMFNVSEDNITEVDSPDKFANIKTDFCIVLQATLSSLSKKYDLEKIMKDNKFGVKVIDEAHMYFHNTIKIDGSSNIKNNWYLTATFGRSSEEEDRLYRQMFSDIKIFRVKDKDPTLFNRKPGTVYGHKPHMNCFMCWAPSGLSDDEVKSVSTSKRYNEKEGTWIRYGISIPKYIKLIIPADKKTVFISKILKIVKKAAAIPYGRMLILSPTIESVEILAKYIKEIFPKYYVGTLHSQNSKETNASVMDKADIIISTVKSSGIGFDAKDLSTLVVVEPFKSLILTEQVSGRLRRRPDGKETYMYDIVDSSVPQLRSWAANRAKFLKAKSKKFTVIDI